MIQRSGTATSAGGEAALREKREDMILVELTQILLGRKMIKINCVNLAVINIR
jgi:hypothetical protein